MEIHHYHRLLKRQLKKSNVDIEGLSPELTELLGRINQSYINHDEDRHLLEDSIDISSEEFREIYNTLQQRTFELEKSYAVLSEFSYIAAHDLKEPLRTISSFTQLTLLNCTKKLDNQSIEYLNLIKSSAAHMEKLIKSLMMYSKIELDSTINSNKEIKLKDVVTSVKSNLYKLIENSSAQIILVNDVNLTCDPISVYQLFQNLIGNAIKYQKPDQPPLVRISSERSEGLVKICVEDNGIGIDNKYKNQVFEPFKRLHTKSQYHGAGIGLAICKKVVTNHGGQIWVDENFDNGTRIWFTLSELKNEI